MVPWYLRNGAWYNILQRWWNRVPKIGVPVPSLNESVLIMIVVGILFLFDLTLASKIDLVETNLNRIFKLLTVYVYIICIFQC